MTKTFENVWIRYESFLPTLQGIKGVKQVYTYTLFNNAVYGKTIESEHLLQHAMMDHVLLFLVEICLEELTLCCIIIRKSVNLFRHISTYWKNIASLLHHPFRLNINVKRYFNLVWTSINVFWSVSKCLKYCIILRHCCIIRFISIFNIKTCFKPV